VWRSETTSYGFAGTATGRNGGTSNRGTVDRRVETTTIHPDGRIETTVHLNPSPQPTKPPSSSSSSSPWHRAPFFLFPGSSNAADAAAATDDGRNGNDEAAATAAGPSFAAWYAHAWSGFKDKIMMCYSPCSAVAGNATTTVEAAV
jgi:hypothetical protein